MLFFYLGRRGSRPYQSRAERRRVTWGRRPLRFPGSSRTSWTIAVRLQYGGRGGLESFVEAVPFSKETAAEIFDGAGLRSQGGGEVAGFGTAIAVKAKQVVKLAVGPKESGEKEPGAIEAVEGFVLKKSIPWVGRSFGNEFDDAGRFAIIERDRGEVGFVAEQAVFGAVMEPVDDA